MVHSMTGYGSAEAVLDGQKYVLEIKSFNHRFLEISVRLPQALSMLEIEIRKKITEKLIRGKIETIIRREAQVGDHIGAAMTLNLFLARNYYELLLQLKDSLDLREEISLGMIANQKDVFVMAEQKTDAVALREGLSVLLDEAMAAMLEMRRREGEALLKDISHRLELMTQKLRLIDEKAPAVVLEYQKRLKERVRELAGGMVVDEARLSQEIAIFAEKSDITEEIVRFRSHLGQFQEMLKSDEAIGRKVDFLIQEMSREINTIGSKSSEIDISRHVIEIKSELAKLREQAQNIE